MLEAAVAAGCILGMCIAADGSHSWIHDAAVWLCTVAFAYVLLQDGMCVHARGV
jgi:hypothetical protein